MKNRFIFLVALACAPLAAEEAAHQGAGKSGNMVAACQGLEEDSACAIVGQLGMETGGRCMVDPQDEVIFCMPEGMPAETIIGEQDATKEPVPKG